jgi:hypothetical protein
MPLLEFGLYEFMENLCPNEKPAIELALEKKPMVDLHYYII